MAFPTTPTDGEIYQGYIYDSALGFWKRYISVSDFNDGTTIVKSVGSGSSDFGERWLLLAQLSQSPMRFGDMKYSCTSWTHGSWGSVKWYVPYQSSTPSSINTNTKIYEYTKIGSISLQLQNVTYNGEQYLALYQSNTNSERFNINGIVSSFTGIHVVSGVTVNSTYSSY